MLIDKNTKEISGLKVILAKQEKMNILLVKKLNKKLPIHDSSCEEMPSSDRFFENVRFRSIDLNDLIC